MASNKTPTTLGSLEFSQIKTSLIDYLKNQSVFSGYNFEGSALNSIVDLLAYNTFYYAYYANMINAEAFLDSAQRQDSLISLCKPLGFVVPASTSAKAKIQVSGIANAASLQNEIPEQTSFFASDGNGIQYTFYTLNKIPINSSGNTELFDVYEATLYSEIDYYSIFDFETQKISIAANNFDIDTIRVQTVENGITYTWTPVNNIGYVSQTDERIFFIERTSTGFAIQFGSKYSLGKYIDETVVEKLFIRYLTTSGSAANGLLNFTIGQPPNGTFSGVIVVSVDQQSTGGRNNPDPDFIRFVAPKWFASQDRAVTVNDYKALLLDAGYFQNETQFNVFGGQDLSPPRYGRVFLTSNINNDSQKITEMINFLKERSIITVLPEYVEANNLNLYADINFGLANSSLNRNEIAGQIRSVFTNQFAKFGQYNVSFSATDCINTLKSEITNDLIITPDDFTLYMEETLNNNRDYTFNLQTELQLPFATDVDITEPFDCALEDFPQGTKALIRMPYITNSSAKNFKANLRLYVLSETDSFLYPWTADIGYVIVGKGLIYIKDGIIANTAQLKVNFRFKTFNIKLNNITTFALKNLNSVG